VFEPQTANVCGEILERRHADPPVWVCWSAFTSNTKGSHSQQPERRHDLHHHRRLLSRRPRLRAFRSFRWTTIAANLSLGSSFRLRGLRLSNAYLNP